jgi:membrane protein implicated in regulation of membrane protease activity
VPVGVIEMNRLWVALGAYAVLAILAATTITDQRFKLATLAVLAVFAIRTWSWSRKLDREARDRQDKD